MPAVRFVLRSSQFAIRRASRGARQVAHIRGNHDSPGGDVPAFANRIATLLGDDRLATAMSASALDWSQRFDWDRAADAMAESVEAARSGS